MKTVAIIILNWNQSRLTQNTIDSFLKINHQNFKYQIILVDNKSTDNSIEQLQKKYSQLVVIIKNKSNLGFAGGNNVGIRWALKNKFQYVLVANNDIRVAPDFLEKLLFEIEKNPKTIVAPKIYFEKGFEFHKNRYKKNDLGKVIWALGGQIDWHNVYGSNIAIDEIDHGQYDDKVSPPDFISGCCFLTTSDLYRQVGLFDPRYYLYLEDADFCIRAKKQNYNLKIVPQSKIWHINSGTAGAASNFQDYFITRNRLLFAYRYSPLRTKLAIFRESLNHLFFGRPWQRYGVCDYYLGKFGKGSWK